VLDLSMRTLRGWGEEGSGRVLGGGKVDNEEDGSIHITF
jgi:hypothetical protein